MRRGAPRRVASRAVGLMRMWPLRACGVDAARPATHQNFQNGFLSAGASFDSGGGTKPK